MNEKEKKDYLAGYKKAKEKGVHFYPDILFKDAVVSLLIFILLAALAYFLGAPLEERANPSDTNYTPKPEWYFLFLFQLLKYFPGELEVIGVIVIPTLAIIFLFLLPVLDRSAKRHYSSRPWIIGITSVLGIGIIFLSIQSIRETPPPAEAGLGDPIAALYAENCASCHGPMITVPEGTNLHLIITQGSHEGGMPAWSGDLTNNEIDALAGFVLSPRGHELFNSNCGECHETAELVSSSPIELKAALNLGSEYPAHSELDIPNWDEVLSAQNRTSLLNFLVAPDGQRLFAINCSACHGRSVAFTGEEAELESLISQGGLHLEMPPWQEKLSSDDLDALARYVSSTDASAEDAELFSQLCSSCHGTLIPQMNDFDLARDKIATGGAHETMPVWGEVLTSEQLDALVSYTMDASEGTPLEVGRDIFSKNCALCHGDFGEGGVNPARPDDVIAPISSAEYLKTRDDHTLFQIIAQGQPNFGMSPFGSGFGGPLDDDQINTIITYMRSWEANPPVEYPPEMTLPDNVDLSGVEIFETLCSQCHRPDGSGIGPVLSDPDFQKNNTDQEIFNTISKGHPNSSMIAWSQILTDDQILQLVKILRNLNNDGSEAGTSGPASFANDVRPLFEEHCTICHGQMGGWNADTSENVINTGNNAPSVIPGDAKNSLLAQKMLGTQSSGGIMPPAGLLAEDQVRIILDWITAGAPDN